MAGARRHPWRWVRRALWLLLAFMGLGPPLYVELTPDRRPALSLPPVEKGRRYRVYVADWGYHTSVIAEQPPGWRMGPPGEEGAAFLEYAWGDRRFYLEGDYRPWSLFATLFLPTESVVYLDGWQAPPRPGNGVRSLFVRTVDADTLRALLTELERSVRHAPGGAREGPFPAADGYQGRFYPAHGAYLWAADCNRWTVERLRGAGLAGSARGVVFSGQVGGRLRGFTRVQTER